MALNNPSSGFFSVPEFQVSPLPWVITGSTSTTDVIKYTLPRVSKSITIRNNETATKKLRIGFTENGVNGVGGNYFFIVDFGSTVTLDARVTEVYVRADASNSISFSLYAGLTTISSAQMPPLTGSLSGSTGGEILGGWSGVG